jgi:hypothetical protein
MSGLDKLRLVPALLLFTDAHCLGKPDLHIIGGTTEGGVHERLVVGKQGDAVASGFPLVHGPGVNTEVRSEGTNAQAHGLAKCLGLSSGPALNSDHKEHHDPLGGKRSR